MMTCLQLLLPILLFANHYDVGPEGQYVDKFIYDISSDSTLNVDVGDKSSEWVNNPANFVNIIMKSSGTESKIYLGGL